MEMRIDDLPFEGKRVVAFGFGSNATPKEVDAELQKQKQQEERRNIESVKLAEEYAEVSQKLAAKLSELTGMNETKILFAITKVTQ